MKKITLILLLSLFTFLSCSDDDDSSGEYEINGTSWIGTGDTISARTITFNDNSTYLYIEPGAGGHNPGTYTFSGKSGILTDSYGTTAFSVTNDLLTIDYDKGTGEYIDDTGIETFIKQ